MYLPDLKATVYNLMHTCRNTVIDVSQILCDNFDKMQMVFVYVIAWSTVVFGINSPNNASRKGNRIRDCLALFSPSLLCSFLFYLSFSSIPFPLSSLGDSSKSWSLMMLNFACFHADACPASEPSGS